ncbi:hypothetical protein [Fluviicola taffensis]|uniref:hypothetical protein n=1 Tax=Fluviicola taffensis TaxID=191579 RepID=UPI0031382AF3
MGSWEYFVLLSYSFPIGIGLALLIQKRLPFISKVILTYLIFTVLVEIIGAILFNYRINNLWLYRIYLYVELIFPSFFFFQQFSKKRSKILLLTVVITGVILITLTNVFDDWQAHASLQTGITFGCVAFIIISYFIEMFRMENVFSPFKDVYFLVGATLLLGHSCTLIYNLLYDYLVVGYFGDEMLKILNKGNLGLILLYNLLYSYALWISKLPRI